MRPDDFFVEDPTTGVGGGASRRLNVTLLDRLRHGPIPGRDDVEVAVPLARLIHNELKKYGTGREPEMIEPEMKDALLALRAVLARLGFGDCNIPFQDFSTFRNWWISNDARGSYQARRKLLSGVFDSLHDELALMEQRSFAPSLVDPISPRARTGWFGVDTEISELRRHFMSARTAQDYRNVGLDCVSVVEALSRQVYDPARHLRQGEAEPPVTNTKQRLDRFVEDAAPGRDNAALRKVARSVIEFAQHVKHSTTPTRREAGIAADAVIQLANLLRRLEEEDV